MIINRTYEQRVREAELEELRRLQRPRAMTRAAETEGAVTRAAKTEDSSSDEREPEDSSSDKSEGEYLKVANEFAAKREAAKKRGPRTCGGVSRRTRPKVPRRPRRTRRPKFLREATRRPRTEARGGGGDGGGRTPFPVPRL